MLYVILTLQSFGGTLHLHIGHPFSSLCMPSSQKRAHTGGHAALNDRISGLVRQNVIHNSVDIE